MTLPQSIGSRLRALIPSGEFGRGVAILASGTAAGQAIAILASPVLTRLYRPADFGVLAIYTSIVGIAGGLAALGYHRAIPLPEDDTDAGQVLGVSMVSTLIVAVFVSVATAVGGSRLAVFLGAPALVPYLWMIPLGVLGLSSYEVLTQWAVRLKAFPDVARTGVAKGVAQTGTQVGLGGFGLGPVGLLLGQLMGQWVGSGSLLRQALKGGRSGLQEITLMGMQSAASRWRRFPQYTAPSVLVSVMGVNAPPLLLSYYFGGTVTGLYALGSRVVMMPVSLVAKSASQVFVASAPTYLREGHLGQEVQLLFTRMLRLAFAPVLILAVSAPALFAVVFGEGWRGAGIYVRWLSPWLLTIFVGFALSPLVSVLERQRAGLIFQSVLSAIRIGSLVVGGILGNALLAIAVFGALSALSWAIYLVWLLVAAGASLSSAASAFFGAAPQAVLLSVPVICCELFEAPDWVSAGVAILSGLASISWYGAARGGSSWRNERS